MRRLSAIAAALALAIAACTRFTVPPIVLERDRAGADLALRDYRRTPALPDPYARAIYCVLEANLDELDAGGVDAGGLIVCKPPPPPKVVTGAPQTFCTEGYSCLPDGQCSCFWRRDAG